MGLNLRKSLFAIGIACAVPLIAGCSVKRLAVNSVADALSGEGGTVFSGDEDPRLVGDALPFALKLYESLLEATPDHPELLMATCKAFTLYAYAYVQLPANRLPDERLDEKKRMLDRAGKLFLRGRDYVLHALEVRHPGFDEMLSTGMTDSALALCNESDTSYLYWAGMSWMGALTTDKFNLGLLMSMPRAVAMVRKVLELNETYGKGSAHEFFISYYGSIPEAMGGSKEKAREHFRRAVELADGARAGPYVALATTVSVKNQDREEFTSLLNKARKVDVDKVVEYRLLNIITQRRAQWLLEHADRFFLSEEDGRAGDESGDEGNGGQGEVQ